MDASRFDRLTAILAAARSRRGLLALASLWGGVGLAADAAGSAKRRRRRRRRRKGGEERKYPVFTTCYTDEGEHGPIPDGPHPTCQSQFDPDEFVPCHPLVTFADLKAACDETYPACQGECRIKAEPIVGLGDCPNFDVCAGPGGDGTIFRPMPGGPYASCWSGPDFKCESCPGHTPDYQGMIAACGTAYPGHAPNGCFDQLDRNDCYPWANCIPDC